MRLIGGIYWHLKGKLTHASPRAAAGTEALRAEALVRSQRVGALAASAADVGDLVTLVDICTGSGKRTGTNQPPIKRAKSFNLPEHRVPIKRKPL